MDTLGLDQVLPLLRCVKCGGDLERGPEGLCCTACGKQYAPGDEGICFMGEYTQADCASFLEIDAVARTVPDRTRPPFEAWEAACRSMPARGTRFLQNMALKNLLRQSLQRIETVARPHAGH